MLKALLSNGVVVLGLSDINLEQLEKGRPILLNLNELHLQDQQILIMHGATEESIMKEIERIRNAVDKKKDYE